MSNTELTEFAETVRRTLGKALADIGLGYTDSAVVAMTKLCGQAEKIVHGAGMKAEQEALREDRFDLAALRVDMRSEAPELEED